MRLKLWLFQLTDIVIFAGKWFSNCAWASLPSGVSGNENFIGTIIGGVSGDLGDTDNSPVLLATMRYSGLAWSNIF